MTMKVAALTQGDKIPAARFRVRQLIPMLRRAGIELTELQAQPSAYPPEDLAGRLAWAPRALASAVRRAVKSRGYDLSLVQRELISTLPTAEALVRRPMIADVDDAIWLYRHGWAANNLARHADHIVVGNEFLARHFRRFCRPLSVIPTGVDTARFKPLTDPARRSFGLIGWSGTWGGYAYFEPLQRALGSLLRRHGDWKIRFVSDRPPAFDQLPAAQVEYYPWSPEQEAELSADMDIGLMPLDDSPWSRGKCSYKMLLNMACEVPVIASDIGMNHDILAMGDVGLGVHSDAEWTAALSELMQAPELRRAMGQAGRKLVWQRFSLEVVSKSWLKVFDRFR